MSRVFSSLYLPAMLLAAALVYGGTGRLDADEPAAPAKEKKAKPAEARGHLPPYYDELVDGEQRQKIYAVQKEYGPEIKKLNAALQEAKAKRDAAIEAVLRPEQKEKLAKLQAEAKAKKEGAMESQNTKEAAKPAAETTTAPATAANGKSS